MSHIIYSIFFLFFINLACATSEDRDDVTNKELPELTELETTSFTGPFPCYHWHVLEDMKLICGGFLREGHLWSDAALKDYFLKSLFNDYVFMSTGVNPTYNYGLVEQAVCGDLKLKAYDYEQIGNIVHFLNDDKLKLRSYEENLNTIIGLRTLIEQSIDILKTNEEFTKLGVDFYRTKAQISHRKTRSEYEGIYEPDGTNRDLQAAVCNWMKQHFSIFNTAVRDHWATYKTLLPTEAAVFERLKAFRPEFMDWPVCKALKDLPPYTGKGRETHYFHIRKSP
jgi:hypothetical protein